MPRRFITWALCQTIPVVALYMAGSVADAQQPCLQPPPVSDCLPAPTSPLVPITPIPSGGTGMGRPTDMGMAATPAFGDLASGAGVGSSAGLTGTPNMFGDQNSTLGQHDRDDFAFHTLAVLGAFKITENESPRPQDRVYATYNYFYNVNSNLGGPGIERTDVNREVLGFEKTFLDGNASIGLRLPFLQVTGDPATRKDGFGDLDVIFKYAFINDRETGNVLSGGLVVTAPTGADFFPADPVTSHSTLLQPYIGYIYGLSDHFYVQGFSSILVPTDSHDITFWFNDIGVGYQVWRSGDDSRGLTSITPIFETHVTSPLNHASSADLVDLTLGTTFGFRQGSSLNLGVATPITGPRPFDVEAQVQFNLHF